MTAIRWGIGAVFITGAGIPGVVLNLICARFRSNVIPTMDLHFGHLVEKSN